MSPLSIEQRRSRGRGTDLPATACMHRVPGAQLFLLQGEGHVRSGQRLRWTSLGLVPTTVTISAPGFNASHGDHVADHRPPGDRVEQLDACLERMKRVPWPAARITTVSGSRRRLAATDQAPVGVGSMTSMNEGSSRMRELEVGVVDGLEANGAGRSRSPAQVGDGRAPPLPWRAQAQARAYSTRTEPGFLHQARSSSGIGLSSACPRCSSITARS